MAGQLHCTCTHHERSPQSQWSHIGRYTRLSLFQDCSVNELTRIQLDFEDLARTNNFHCLEGMWGGSRTRGADKLTSLLAAMVRWPPRDLWDYDQMLLRREVWPEVLDSLVSVLGGHWVSNNEHIIGSWWTLKHFSDMLGGKGLMKSIVKYQLRSARLGTEDGKGIKWDRELRFGIERMVDLWE